MCNSTAMPIAHQPANEGEQGGGVTADQPFQQVRCAAGHLGHDLLVPFVLRKHGTLSWDRSVN